MSDSLPEADLLDEGGSKKRLADLLVRVCAVLGCLAYVPSAYLAWRERLWFILGMDSLALAYILLLALLPRASYRLKTVSLAVLGYGLGMALLFAIGPFGAGHLYLFCFVVLVGLFGNARLVVGANLLCVAGYAAFWAYAAQARPAWTQGPASIIVVAANAVLLGAVLSAAANFLVRRYAYAAAAERRRRELRETMLREIDHRVKNNLQMLSSLVSLRSRAGADPAEALAQIKESLSAIVLVHQLLDREEAHYSLKAGRYLEALVERFASSYPNIDFQYAWKGPEIEVDSDDGIDLGLMINEIVVNSIKHAFSAGAKGRVFLRGEAEPGTRKVAIVVGDDGRGLPDRDPPVSQGRKIIDALARHLDAKMTIDDGPGLVYRFELIFPELEGADHASATALSTEERKED